MDNQVDNLEKLRTANITVILRDDDTGLEVRRKIEVFNGVDTEYHVTRVLFRGMGEMLKEIGIVPTVTKEGVES